jgi:hypothetical protein
MVKRFGVLLAALAIIAIAVPAMAGAHAVTKAKKVLAPVGNVLTLTGNDVTITSAVLGPITCERLDGTATLTKNNGAEWEAAGAAVAPPPQVGCANGARVVNVTSLEISKIRAAGAETWMNFKLTLDINAAQVVECTYVGNAVPFTYVAGEEGANRGVITFNKAAGVAGGACGAATLDGTFLVEIGAVAVILD